MANRIIGDLRSIRQSTDTLRLNLIGGGLSVGNNETLTGLVAKVPLLYTEPIPTPPEDEWTPDPLWLFPDPNDSDTPKNIEELYDDDPMANDYTYRAIYMINGAFPTTNLRGGRTSGHIITYVTSDGTTYTDTTGTTLEHAWDTTKDVIDSNGNPVRYIKVYTNTAQTTVQNFQNTLVWVVYNLGTTISGYSSQRVDYGFSHNYSLQSIVIPDGVTSIGNNAFYSCYSLQSIVIPDGVTSIGNNAFYSCYSLQSIVIPDSVISLDSSLFKSCTNLKSILLPNNIETIPSGCFNYCRNLKNLTIPNSVTKFLGSSTSGTGCFEDCTTLETIILSENLADLGMRAFYSCYSLQSIVIPDSVTSIGNNAFYSCYSLQSIVIPDGVTSIGNNAFYSCYSLQSIVIPDSVTSIETNAFYSCYSLNSVILPHDFNVSGLALSQSNMLSPEAIIAMFEQLKDLTGQTAKTITLGTTNKAKLTAEQLEIATNKNWTVA